MIDMGEVLVSRREAFFKVWALSGAIGNQRIGTGFYSMPTLRKVLYMYPLTAVPRAVRVRSSHFMDVKLRGREVSELPVVIGLEEAELGSERLQSLPILPPRQHCEYSGISGRSVSGAGRGAAAGVK